MKKPKMNIMTSCDDGIAEYILPQLASLSATNSRYDIDFYLFHTSITDEHIKLIRDYGETVHINVVEIKITDTVVFDTLATAGGRWPREAYYTVGLQNYLPENIDRIMYVDASDAFWNGDCGRFYYADFEGKALIATMYRASFEQRDGMSVPVPFEPKDLEDSRKRSLILRGAFSSGTVLYNLARIRGGGYETDDFIKLAERIAKLTGRDTDLFFGDQGLLSAAYLGDVKYWGFPNCVLLDPKFGAVYNFTAYNHEAAMIQFAPSVPPGYNWIEPVILHFDAPEWKPWKPCFRDDEIHSILFPDPDEWHVPNTMADWQSVYWDYVRMTPIYDKMLNEVLEHCKNNNT